jgi:hypothetical protein
MEASEVRAFVQRCENAQVIVGDDAFDFFCNFQSVTQNADEHGSYTPKLDWTVIPTLKTFSADAPAWIEIAAPPYGLRFVEPVHSFGALTYEADIDDLPVDESAREAIRINFAKCERLVVQHQFLEPNTSGRLQYLGVYLVGRRTDSGEIIRGRANRDFVRRPGRSGQFIDGGGDETDYAARHHQGLSDEIAFHVLGVNSLVHCRNVRVDDIKPSPKLSDVHRRKFAKKSEARRLESFRRVNLSAFRRELEDQARAAGNTDVSLHFVRPHFAHYGGIDPATGRERGLLFGKTEGVFFRPLRIAGTPERGVATKEYHVGDAPDDVIAAGLERLRQTDRDFHADLGRFPGI